jgi:hypothetical protein
VARLRLYHPDYEVTWVDRLYDFFSGHTLPPRQEGVDYTLIDRAAMRTVREFMDGISSIAILGDEMVRVESGWSMAEDPNARFKQAEALTTRLRICQLQSTGARLPLIARWFQFEESPTGTRLLARLLAPPNPALRPFLSGNLGVDATLSRPEWVDIIIR